MGNKIRLTSYFIGEDHLLIQCAKIFLNKGHKIQGIISPLNAAKEFASENKIKYFYSLDEALDTLLTADFDYLFSIIHSTIIPFNILQRARQLPINFHNAPLPHYAGVHALSWAILNNESQYGVTWHVMTDVIDGGDLLKQAHFLIDKNETALSLSLKCYTHALSLFKTLINDLSCQNIIRTPQNQAQSSYYSFKQKPPGNGWINWDDTASHIERMVRALELGHYHHNRLSVPKIKIGNTAYIVKKLRILNEASDKKPGTLVAIKPLAWTISTQSMLINIEQLHHLDGTDCPLADLLKQHPMKIGTLLRSPSLAEHQEYQSLSEQLSSSELFWVRTLIDFKPALLPLQPQSSDHYIDDKLMPLAQNKLTQEQLQKWGDTHQPTDILLATILIYLYRLGNQTASGIWVYSAQYHDIQSHLRAFFSPFIPLSLTLTPKTCVREAIRQIQIMRALMEKKGLFQRDVFYRYPELAQIEHHHYPLALFIGTNRECSNKLKQSTASVLITLSSDTHEITWWIKEKLMHKETQLGAMIHTSTQHLELLMNSMPSNLDKAISELSLMNHDERQKIISQWQTVITTYPKHKTIHQLFEEQVHRTPDNIAVIYGKKSLSFKELNQKANQLARCLQKKGVLSNSFVAICTTQELHLIIGILAILKSGAAYIPIDASYPRQHIENVLADSKPSLVLASNQLHSQIEQECALLNIPIYLFTTLSTAMKLESSDEIKQAHATSKSLAYIMYTSGSTGKPKGVMIPHQGVIRLVINTNYIHITEHDKIAQAASISFDASTFEIWGALLNGATLVAVPHTTLLDPCKFTTFLEQNNITILWVTSALFNQYVAHNPAIFRHLTYLLVGGDVLNKERIMSVLACEQGAPKVFLNGYGPTENTTFTTTYHITKEDRHHETIPIGKPIANSEVFVLDEFLEPTPIGIIGELYAGGDGLALGYLNRPELNEKFFIKNPFCLEKRSLLYKTGDSARWLPDGQLEYIGRQDNQVKIRGYRVELEAIQAHLLHHRDISECCVRAEESKQQGKVLVAYIVCTNFINEKELRDFLGHELPVYMIPSYFIVLDTMPLTTNGKIDYNKLPKPELNKPIVSKEYIAPTTSKELLLQALWSKLLGHNSIGMNDNFFDLGGHSLLITQLVLQVKKLYGTDLPLHEFLEQPTINHLTRLIENNSTQTVITTQQLMLADRYLPPELQLPHNNIIKQKKPAHILLTGASGFLGAHLLYELYHSTSAIIYCLVRAKNEYSAIQKLNATLSKYHFDIQCNKRIIPLLGDLTSPQLGLPSNQLAHLSKIIDIIFHNGALVNHLYNYELLRAANVTSTIEIIRFAMQEKIKPLHYVSTLSAACTFLDDSQNIIENFINIKHNTSPPNDGYSQTKWVTEQILSEAYLRGFPVAIYRPGWITGHTKTGAINAENNHLLRLLKGCIQLKVAPAWKIMLDMLPVDIISQIITQNALHDNHAGKVFNLINPNKLSWLDLIQYINQRGYNVALINPMEWKENHLKYIDEKNALFSFYSLYINATDKDWMHGLATISRANSYNTNSILDKAGQRMPKMNQSLLNTYFNYLEQENFIIPPSH